MSPILCVLCPLPPRTPLAGGEGECGSFDVSQGSCPVLFYVALAGLESRTYNFSFRGVYFLAYSITSIPAMSCANTFAPPSLMLLFCVPANVSELTSRQSHFYQQEAFSLSHPKEVFLGFCHPTPTRTFQTPSTPFQPLIQSQNASCANHFYDNKTY